MPTRRAQLGQVGLGVMDGLMPSTVISPFWKGSSALMVLMSVDLPEPEGPHTTTTSPLLMRGGALVEHLDWSRTTWKRS
jgi:hypothetical protein